MTGMCQGRSARALVGVTSLISVVTLLLWLASLAGLLGTLWWPLDLFSHFKVQYTAIFLACFLFLICGRHWRTAGLALAGALLNGAAVAAGAILPVSQPDATGPLLRVVSLNVALGNDETGKIAGFLAGSNADVLVLQELAGDRAKDLARRLTRYPHVFMDAAQPAWGAVVLSRWPIRKAEVIELASRGSTAARVVLAVGSRDVTLVGVHLHWPMGSRSAHLRETELESLARVLASTEGSRIAVGDFNLTPWSGHFVTMLEASGMRDCARGRWLVPTWPVGWWSLGIRIDQCLRSPDIAVLDVSTGPDIGSDHYPTINDFRLPG